MESILEKYFPDVFLLAKEIEYNEQINIEDYFGTQVIMIHAGHGGSGWDKRELFGYYKEDKKNLDIRRFNGKSLCEVELWPASIIFPHRLDHILQFVNDLLFKTSAYNNGYSRLQAIRTGIKWNMK